MSRTSPADTEYSLLTAKRRSVFLLLKISPVLSHAHAGYMELFSSLLYQQMSAWCCYHSFEGTADFLRRHAQEEMEHMQRLFADQTDTGCMPQIMAVDAPVAEFDSLTALFKNVCARTAHHTEN